MFSINTIRGEKKGGIFGGRVKPSNSHAIYEKWYSECGDLNDCSCKTQLKSYFDCSENKNTYACKNDFWEIKKVVKKVVTEEITEPSPTTEKVTEPGPITVTEETR